MALVDSWEAFIRIHGGEPGARYIFEKAMFELLSVENPDKEVHKLNASHGDGGIDVYVHQGQSAIDIYQCKFFMGAMNSSRWSQIKKSFERCKNFIQSYNTKKIQVRNWYLCMPREMQKEDIEKWNSFKTNNASFVNDIKLIDGNEIIERMRKCDRLYNTDMISRYFTIPSEADNINNIDNQNQKSHNYAICRALYNCLESINQEKGCNDEIYVPLEVQTTRTIKDKQRRKTEDLLSCLKNAYGSCFLDTVWNQKIHSKKLIYLLLGEPGSGKSIALRKFCLDLLSRPKHIKKIPLYIDLGKWTGKWSAVNPPDKKDLINYIKKNLNDTIQDPEQNIYCKNNFNRMLEEGHWLFVFDSFDEIPCLMGSGNNHELIGIISKLIHDFLTSGKRGGGIVASRYYKEPSEYLDATVTLEIKEFNDLRIKSMLNKYLGNASDVVDELFRYHERLVTLCRNPFYLSLLIGYIKNKGKKFPKDQMELYNHYLNSSLEKHDGMMREFKLKISDVTAAAKELSAFMQQSTEYGLECPMMAFYAKYGEEKKWNDCLQILKKIKLCHYNTHEGTISFVHRRFQEFFIAENFKDAEKSQNCSFIDYYTIISYDSGLRDALALYCEVADLEKATEIARLCWQSLKDHIVYRTTMKEKGSLVLVNTLYFMVDAFRNRRDAISEFYNDYEKFIIKYLAYDTHFIIQVAMVKGVLLFNPERKILTQMVLQTFELGNERLNDIMMENCRLI